jgi:hypothetical protein
MQAMSDEQRIDSLEKKIDKGFAETRAQILSSERALRGEIIEVRTDARADFRTLVALVFGLWTATVLAVVGVLVAHF